MFRLKSLLLVFAISTVVSVCYAQNGGSPFQQLAEMDPGVQNIKPKTGPIESFIVIGKGEVKRALPKALAVKYAVKEAERSARAAATKFFNTSVKWEQTDSGEMVCSTKGSSAGDDGEATSATSASATETSVEVTRQCAEAALAGLTLVWTGYDSTGFRVQIWGWKASNMANVVRAGKMMGDAAHATVDAAKVVEGARIQDPHRAHHDAEKEKGVPPSSVPPTGTRGNNIAPNQNFAQSSDAEDFL